MQANRAKEMGQKLSNWGRWGPEDEAGTTNFITPETIVKASRLVKKGKVFSLAIPFTKKGVQGYGSYRINPTLMMHYDSGDSDSLGLQMPGNSGCARFTDDMMIMSLQAATHWDALSHAYYDGKMYNNFDASLVSSFGAARDSITAMQNRLVSRGVLLDMARYKGVDSLKEGEVITTEDLEGCARSQATSVEPGDIVLIRTGYMTKYYDARRWKGYTNASLQPGLSWRTAPWFHDNQIAAVASDLLGLEVMGELPEENQSPLHIILLRDMGLTIGEIFYLDKLAADCAGDHVYEFFFLAQPLPIEKAVSSPINPIAIK